MASKVYEIPAVYIAGAACSGCSVSLINTINPSVQNLLVDPVIPGKHISLRFHATIMAGQGEPVIKVLRDTTKEMPGKYVLMIDGSIPTGEDGLFCTLGEIDGKEVPVKELYDNYCAKKNAEPPTDQPLEDVVDEDLKKNSAGKDDKKEKANENFLKIKANANKGADPVKPKVNTQRNRLERGKARYGSTVQAEGGK